MSGATPVPSRLLTPAFVRLFVAILASETLYGRSWRHLWKPKAAA